MIGKDFVLISGFSTSWGKTTAKTYALDVTNPNASWRSMDNLPEPKGITHSAFVVIGMKFYMCGGYLGKFLVVLGFFKLTRSAVNRWPSWSTHQDMPCV